MLSQNQKTPATVNIRLSTTRTSSDLPPYGSTTNEFLQQIQIKLTHSGQDSKQRNREICHPTLRITMGLMTLKKTLIIEDLGNKFDLAQAEEVVGYGQ